MLEVEQVREGKRGRDMYKMASHMFSRAKRTLGERLQTRHEKQVRI